MTAPPGLVTMEGCVEILMATTPASVRLRMLESSASNVSSSTEFISFHTCDLLFKKPQILFLWKNFTSALLKKKSSTPINLEFYLIYGLRDPKFTHGLLIPVINVSRLYFSSWDGGWCNCGVPNFIFLCALRHSGSSAVGPRVGSAEQPRHRECLDVSHPWQESLDRGEKSKC